MAYVSGNYRDTESYRLPATWRPANASSVGYAAFALTLWMFSMIKASWFDASQVTLVMMLAVVLGGTAMALAGLMAWFRGRAHDSCLFLAFAAFWWTWALVVHDVNTGAIAPSANFYGWYFAVWAVVGFFLFIAAFRAGTGRVLFDLALWLSLIWFAIGEWSGIGGLTILGGYLGLVASVLAIYLAGAGVINATFGRILLPTGEPQAVEPVAVETRREV